MPLQLAKVDIAESIDSEMDGDLQKAFLTLGNLITARVTLHFYKTESLVCDRMKCLILDLPHELSDLYVNKFGMLNRFLFV